MKKTLSIICLGAALLAPVDSSAYFEIELVNGTHLLTSDRWQEELETKFTYGNGVVGIKSSDILRISKRNGTLKKPAAPPKVVEKSAPEVQHTDDPFLEKFSYLQEQFSMVPVMNEKDLYGLAKELTEFRNQVLKARKGSSYSGEIKEVYAMFDVIEKQLEKNH